MRNQSNRKGQPCPARSLVFNLRSLTGFPPFHLERMNQLRLTDRDICTPARYTMT